jgi:hypothetical protein
MATLSIRCIDKIGIDPPKPANPEDHELHQYDSEYDSEYESENETESEFDYQASCTENDSDISDCENTESVKFIRFKKLIKDAKCYTVILQEEEFVPE